MCARVCVCVCACVFSRHIEGQLGVCCSTDKKAYKITNHSQLACGASFLPAFDGDKTDRTVYVQIQLQARPTRQTSAPTPAAPLSRSKMAFARTLVRAAKSVQVSYAEPARALATMRSGQRCVVPVAQMAALCPPTPCSVAMVSSVAWNPRKHKIHVQHHSSWTVCQPGPAVLCDPCTPQPAIPGHLRRHGCSYLTAYISPLASTQQFGDCTLL